MELSQRFVEIMRANALTHPNEDLLIRSDNLEALCDLALETIKRRDFKGESGEQINAPREKDSG